MSHKKIYILIIQVIVVISVAYFMAYIMNIGVGGAGEFQYVILMVFFLLLTSSSKKIFWIFIFPFICLHALYTPIGLSFGEMSYDFFVAGLSTDLLEAEEFSSQIKIVGYVLAIILIITAIVFRYLMKRFDLHFYRNKTFLFIALVVSLVSQAPGNFPRQIQAAFTKWDREIENLKSLKKESRWQNVSLKNDSYDNYLLVIGESARKDYHNAYGYPVDNTPFMSSSVGVLVDGLTSGGVSTVPSLKVMLTYSSKKDWEADYAYNIVNLAKEAGLETYWLSNQGYLGAYDTPISAIAQSSARTFFTKFGEYNSNNTSDFVLIKELKRVLNSHPKQKKLIVMHLYGSHPLACDRVSDYPLLLETTEYYSYLNCYISSIHKTDDILKESYKILDQLYKKNHQTFSMIYFADHGLSHNEVKGKMYLNIASISNFHYDIPLFKVSSNDKKRLVCKSFKSALNFTNGLANWMRINTSNLDQHYSLFDCHDDPDDFGLSDKIKVIGHNDPAIVIKSEKAINHEK